MFVTGSIILTAFLSLLLLVLAGGVAGGIFIGAGILQRLSARQRGELSKINAETAEIEHRVEIRSVQRSLEIDALLEGKALPPGAPIQEKEPVLVGGDYEDGSSTSRKNWRGAAAGSHR